MPPGPARQPILGEGGPGRTSRRHGRDRIGTGRAGSPGPFFTSGPGSLGARPCPRLPGRHFARLLPGEDWQPMPPPVWKACGKRIGRPCRKPGGRWDTDRFRSACRMEACAAQPLSRTASRRRHGAGRGCTTHQPESGGRRRTTADPPGTAGSQGLHGRWHKAARGCWSCSLAPRWEAVSVAPKSVASSSGGSTSPAWGLALGRRHLAGSPRPADACGAGSPSGAARFRLEADGAREDCTSRYGRAGFLHLPDFGGGRRLSLRLDLVSPFWLVLADWLRLRRLHPGRPGSKTSGRARDAVQEAGAGAKRPRGWRVRQCRQLPRAGAGRHTGRFDRWLKQALFGNSAHADSEGYSPNFARSEIFSGLSGSGPRGGACFSRRAAGLRSPPPRTTGCAGVPPSADEPAPQTLPPWPFCRRATVLKPDAHFAPRSTSRRCPGPQ